MIIVKDARNRFKPRRGDIISPLRGLKMTHLPFFYNPVIPTGLALNSPEGDLGVNQAKIHLYEQLNIPKNAG